MWRSIEPDADDMRTLITQRAQLVAAIVHSCCSLRCGHAVDVYDSSHHYNDYAEYLYVS